MSTDNSEWTVLEKLLLTQAVYKYGENMWFQVARVLKQHGLIQPNQRQSDFFSQKNCQFQYYLLVQNLEAEKQVYRSIDLQNDMPVVVRIARQLYLQRVEEVKAELKRDEEKFGQLAKEIEQIKSGQWDEKLREQLSPADREAMDKQAASDQNKASVVIETVEDKSESDKEVTSSTNAATTGPSLPAGRTTEEKKLLENVTQQENSMKRTSSETIILSASSSKRFRLEESKNEVSDNSSEDQVISTAISTAIATPNKNDTRSRLPQETVPLPLVVANVLGEMNVKQSSGEDASISAHNITADKAEATQSTAINDAMSNTEFVMGKESPSTSKISVTEPTQNTTPIVEDTAADMEVENKEGANGHYTALEEVVTVNYTAESKAPEPPASDPQQKKIEQEHSAQQYLKEQPEQEKQQHVQPLEPSKKKETNGNSNQSEEQHALSQQEEQQNQQKLPMSAVHHLPKIIIPEASSSSSLPYQKFHQDQSASPISKLHSIDSNSHSIMTPDEEDFSARSETATPTSTTSAIERRKTSSSDQRQKAWQKNIYLLWQEIANHKNGTIFMNPIKKSHAPLYDKVVKQPLYLKTIKNRVRDGIVKTTAEFERDIVLMLTNSLMYNKEGTETYQMALEMLDDVREQFRLFKSADGYSNSYWEYD